MRKLLISFAAVLLGTFSALADGPVATGCQTTGCTITGPIFTTYDPTVTNPQFIFGTTSPISPNNSSMEIDCWVSGTVCPIVGIQNNQFATVAAAQPILESWRGHCTVANTFTISDWSGCAVHTSDALGLWQSEGADGYAPTTYSVVTATPTTAGSGYNVNDTITLAGGTLATSEGANDVRAVVTVDTLTGGAGTGVATAHVTTLGAYTTAPGLTGVTQLSTGGTGTGAIFTITKANHANSNAVNIMTQVDSVGLCGSVSGLNIPGEILFGTHNPYDNSTSAAALSPLGMKYAMKIRCDQSVDFFGGVTTNGASGGGLYYVTSGSGVRNKWFDTNTGAISPASYVFPGGASAGFDSTGNLTIAPNSTSAAAWTTNAVRFIVKGATYTDSSSSGTVPAVYADRVFTPTLAASSATTYTNAYTFDFEAPAAGSNVTITNGYAIRAVGISDTGTFVGTSGATLNGATISLNNSSNNAVNIATGTSSGIVTIGNSGNTGTTKLAGLSTGTAVDVLCLTSGSVVILQAAGSCTISSRRFKENIHPLTAKALPVLRKLPVVSFQMKPAKTPNRDPNYRSKQVGLLAEDVAHLMPECALYERNMKTPKSYRPECVIAYLVKGMQEQQTEIAVLQRRASTPPRKAR